jgi:hypothetical protein
MVCIAKLSIIARIYKTCEYHDLDVRFVATLLSFPAQHVCVRIRFVVRGSQVSPAPDRLEFRGSPVVSNQTQQIVVAGIHLHIHVSRFVFDTLSPETCPTVPCVSPNVPD